MDTKNNEERVIPLSTHASDLMDVALAYNSDWLFPRDDMEFHIDESTARRSLDKIAEWSKVKACRNDLKRTFLTVAEDLEISPVKGVGWQSSWPLVMEFFAWRAFRNRREIGACAGLTPTPYDSGDRRREQGICKAGHKKIRCLRVEPSWLWLRYQPDSALSQGYRRRFAKGGKRQRRIGIVAMARKLRVALWRYVEHGVIPEGALLSP
ncbi:MAG: transposase [Proteobacteria bacterium]|nr:transposase [Pseudomonadota bacterium]